MGRIDGYSAYNAGFNRNIYNNGRTEQAENRQTESKTVEKKSSIDKTETKQPELSQKAKDLLKELKKKYGDMDFFVADYSSDEEAQKYLSRGTKQYSVLIEPDILEEMAADGSVRDKYLGIINEAKNKIAEAKDELAKMDDSEKGGNKSHVKSLGFTIKPDGSVSFFAELEKSSTDQSKRIEQAREEKRAKKKEEEKAEKTEKLNEQREERIKKGIVKADSVEELMKNIKSFDWDNATEEIRSRTGRYFDMAT